MSCRNACTRFISEEQRAKQIHAVQQTEEENMKPRVKAMKLVFLLLLTAGVVFGIFKMCIDVSKYTMRHKPQYNVQMISMLYKEEEKIEDHSQQEWKKLAEREETLLQVEYALKADKRQLLEDKAKVEGLRAAVEHEKEEISQGRWEIEKLKAVIISKKQQVRQYPLEQQQQLEREQEEQALLEEQKQQKLQEQQQPLEQLQEQLAPEQNQQQLVQQQNQPQQTLQQQDEQHQQQHQQWQQLQQSDVRQQDEQPEQLDLQQQFEEWRKEQQQAVQQQTVHQQVPPEQKQIKELPFEQQHHWQNQQQHLHIMQQRQDQPVQQDIVEPQFEQQEYSHNQQQHLHTMRQEQGQHVQREIMKQPFGQQQTQKQQQQLLQQQTQKQQQQLLQQQQTAHPVQHWQKQPPQFQHEIVKQQRPWELQVVQQQQQMQSHQTLQTVQESTEQQQPQQQQHQHIVQEQFKPQQQQHEQRLQQHMEQQQKQLQQQQQVAQDDKAQNMAVQRIRRLPWLGMTPSVIMERYPGIVPRRDYKLRPFVDPSDPGAAGLENRPLSSSDMSKADQETRFYSLLQMKHVECIKARRLGSTVDGGWHVLCTSKPYKPKRGKCLIYFFGVENNWSFVDSASKRYDCDIKAFDPGLGLANHARSAKVSFYNLGLGAANTYENGKKLTTLKTIVHNLGNDNDIIDFLKINIHYYDWSNLRVLALDDTLQHVKQLGVEVDISHVNKTVLPSLSADFPSWYSTLLNLEKVGFRRFLNYRNPSGKFYSVTTQKNRTYHFELYYININFLKR